jgi:hypothetical protein
MLTPREAHKLGDRLLTRSEMATLQFPPGDPRNTLRLEEQDPLRQPRSSKVNTKATRADVAALAATDDVADDDDPAGEVSVEELLREAQSGDDVVEGPASVQLQAVTSANTATRLTTIDGSALPKALTNPSFLGHVASTSPWRNPLLWPANVLPTDSRRRNVIRPPEDPLNPFLEQSRFAVPRGEFSFRRPPGEPMFTRFLRNKGAYKPTAYSRWLQQAQFALPYYPTITDITIAPTLQAFAGGYDRFAMLEQRKLAVREHQRLAQPALSGLINPLLAEPTKGQLPALAAEVRKLEQAAGGEQPRLAERLRSLPPPPPPLNASSMEAAKGGRLLHAAIGRQGDVPLGNPFGR